MLIREFAQSDLARLTQLTIETFQAFYEGSFRPLVGDAVFDIQHGKWRDDYRQQVPGLHDPEQNKYVAVAEADSVIVGYVGWQADPFRGHGRIEILAVAEDHRRDHVGTVLCQHAFSELRGLGAKMVEIGTGGDAFHAPARGLYESLGCVKLPTAVYFRQL
ncbi:GNAT family N-acetyltransferase [Streptomyces sp. NPDC003006]